MSGATMRMGVQFRCSWPPERLVEFARAVEAHGFDELWIVEDCFFAAGPTSVATALAATDRIAVGLGIVPAVARNAAFTAMELATIERLHPGRFLPGIGHGVGAWMEQIGARPASPLQALGEVTSAVRGLLAGQEVTVDGRFVRLDRVRLEHPPAVAPPVSLGVRGPKSLALSGRVADGTILAEGASVPYVSAAIGHIAADGPHRLTVFGWWAPSADDLRPTVARALRKDRNDAQLVPLGIDADVAAWRQAGASEADVPETWIDLLGVVGDPSVRAAELQALGVTTLVLTPVATLPW